jgi:hypothetical protein
VEDVADLFRERHVRTDFEAIGYEFLATRTMGPTTKEGRTMSSPISAPTSQAPSHGWTNAGFAVHGHTKDFLPTSTSIQRLNSRLAVRITNTVGSMWCAYAFAGLALVSLPEAISSHSLVTIVSWISQTFLQLVLLSVIMVGQNLLSAAGDARSAKTFEDTEALRSEMAVALDRLDTATAGGLKAVIDAVRESQARR